MNSVTHSTRLKRWLNPVLRLCGWSIVSVVDVETGAFVRYELRRYPAHCSRHDYEPVDTV